MADSYVTEFPTEYLTALDEELAQASFSSKYDVAGAEFVSKKTVKVPRIEFDNGLMPYDGFQTDTGASLIYDTYELDHDDQATFRVDAVEDIDTAHILSANLGGEFIRTKAVPEMDADFFEKMVKLAGNRSTTALTPQNVKSEIRKMRTAFTQAGLTGGDLYMSSAALELLENAIDRQFAGEGTITDSVGSYNGFTIYEVPEVRLGTGVDFIGIAPGCARYIKKRAASYIFQPGSHPLGDDWLSQFRWVYGAIVRLNRKPGIYAHHSAEVGVNLTKFTAGTFEGVIDNDAKTVAINVPASTPITGLAISYEDAAMACKQGNTPIENGVTTVYFTSGTAKNFTFTAANGIGTATYKVTVTVASE
nr:MAG TPA: major capsid protein [Caudoviricetes sp.]